VIREAEVDRAVDLGFPRQGAPLSWCRALCWRQAQ
jgi:hypothetical protein